MNPLVDAYGSLSPGEKVSDTVLEKSRKDVREFIIKLFLTTLAFYTGQRLVFG